VLVVDDEESMRFFLRRALTRRGFAVQVAPDGPAALARFGEARPDAVLLDVRMPGMGGREVLERLRARDAAVPILMMTGYGNVEDATAAMWAGATDYVRKPLRADDVAGALERALSARGAGAPGPSTVRALASLPRGGPAPAAPVPQPAEAPRDPADWLRAECAARGLPGDPGGAGDLEVHAAVRLFETVFLDELLRRACGNVARAARVAGVSRPNLHRKMRALGLDAGRYRGG